MIEYYLLLKAEAVLLDLSRYFVVSQWYGSLYEMVLIFVIRQ